MQGNDAATQIGERRQSIYLLVIGFLSGLFSEP
jgi:hypothetical protein